MTLKEKLRRLVYLGFQKYRVIPKNQMGYRKLTRHLNLALLYPRIKDLEGIVVECGVAQGHTLAVLKILSIAEGHNRPVWGFDTFEGLPDGSGDFSYSEDAARQYFKDTQVPLDGVMMVKGDIRDTLKNFDEKIAFLHIDLDLYDGYKSALEMLWPHVAEGGVVVFDDYNEPKWTGATTAVDEFVAARNLTLHSADWAYKYYLIK